MKTSTKGKIIVLIKLAFIWLMVAGLLIIKASRGAGEGFSLLMFDIKTDFADNPILPLQFKNKIIFLAVTFVLLTLGILFTEDFRLKLGLGKWKIELRPGSGILRWGSNLCLAVVTLGFLCTTVFFVKQDLQHTGREGWEGDLLIAHACGGIENVDYTNSIEAFENSYQKGIRTLEIDFRLTSDDRMVCIHEWRTQMSSNYEAGYVYSEEEFMNIQVFDSYTPMSLETLFELMRKYEDTWIITDTKDADRVTIQKDFQILVDTARKTDSLDLLDRFIVQIYNYEMYDYVDDIYPFPSYILTLYMLASPDNGRITEFCRFCKSKGINTITMWASWATPEVMTVAKIYGIDIYVHTVNEIDDLKQLRDIGVKGFYTDYIYPENIKDE